MGIVPAIPTLSESRRLRPLAFLLLYISQGVPVGLASIAIPAWMFGGQPLGYAGGGLCLIAGYGRMETLPASGGSARNADQTIVLQGALA